MDSGSDISEIRAIIEANRMYRVEREVPGPEEVSKLREAIGAELPPGYLVFLELRGLEDLRFENEILDPSEIRRQHQYVARHGLVPFASNGCGDLICWSLEELPGSASYFWDHETDTYKSFGHSSFVEALRSWRF